MKNMTKTFPGAQKPVLSNIDLQFYQGAKIGIVGPNGVGKSTLMKIMAGIDTDYTGEAWPGEYITVGYLAQEPELDPTKTVLENVKDGAREVADMVERFNQIGMEMGEEGADFDALGTEMGELQAKIDAVDGWTLDNQLEIAMEALRCPPGDSGVKSLSGGEKRRVAREPPQGIRRRGADDHPRPLLPRQRGRLDPRTRSRQVLPLRGQLLDLPREEGQAPGAGRARGEWTLEGTARGARVDPADPGRAPDQVQGAHPQVRAAAGSAEQPQAGQGPDRHPGARAARRQGHRGQGNLQGLRRQAAVRGPELHPAPRRDRRGDRPERRGQVDAVQDHHRQGAAGFGHDRHRHD